MEDVVCNRDNNTTDQEQTADPDDHTDYDSEKLDFCVRSALRYRWGSGMLP